MWCENKCVGAGQAGLGQACCSHNELCGTGLTCQPPNGCQCDPSKLTSRHNG